MRFLSFGIGVSVLLLAWAGCFLETEKSDDSPIKVHVINNASRYVGAPLKFWATFGREIADRSLINWETGYGEEVGRGEATAGQNLSSDTIYLEWNQLPPSTRRDSASNEYGHFDTVRVLVEGLESAPVAIEIENIFPVLDSLIINDIKTVPKGDSIYFRVHGGSNVNVHVYYTDRHKITPNSLEWPGNIMDLKDYYQGTDYSTATYEFGVSPKVPYDQSGVLKLRDGEGYTKSWKLRYQTYEEGGSIWVGTTSELLKVTSGGLELFRTDIEQNDKVVLGINGNNLYLTESNNKVVRKFNTRTFKAYEGFQLGALNDAQAIAVGDQFLWIAQEDRHYITRSFIAKYAAGDGDPQNISIVNIPGRVLSMDINSNQSSGLWFINSEEDKIFFAVDDSIALELVGLIENPRVLSFDPAADVCWIASHTDVIEIDAEGNKRGSVEGFGNIRSISAGLGGCWVADHLVEKVYFLDGDITEDRDVSQLFPTEFSVGFNEPVAVSINAQKDLSCWVADEGTGSVVKLNRHGREVARLTGLSAPQVIAVNQGE